MTRHATPAAVLDTMAEPVSARILANTGHGTVKHLASPNPSTIQHRKGASSCP